MRLLTGTPLTTRQVLANIWPVVFDLTPTYALRSIAALDASFFAREQIALVVWDVDGTLMSYHDSRVAPEFAGAFASLVRSGPTKHAVLSNCTERRFEALSAILPEIPIFRAYETKDGMVTRVRLGSHDTITPADLVQLASHGAQQIRKPDARLVPAIMKEMGVQTAYNTLVVGDQYFTDVATARLAGARSAKVEPFDPGAFPLRIRFSQWLERQAVRLTGVRVSMAADAGR